MAAADMVGRKSIWKIKDNESVESKSNTKPKASDEEGHDVQKAPQKSGGSDASSPTRSTKAALSKSQAEDDAFVSSLLDESGDSLGVHAAGKLPTAALAEALLRVLERKVGTMKRQKNGTLVIRDLDISKNRSCNQEFLSHLVDLLTTHSVIVQRFRFYGAKNIDDRALKNLAQYFGSLEKGHVPLELHLSDCSFTEKGFVALIRSITGNSAFPYRNPSGRARPLYLRVENNYIAADVLQQWLASPLVQAIWKVGEKRPYAEPRASTRVQILALPNGVCSQKAGQPASARAEEAGSASTDEEAKEEGKVNLLARRMGKMGPRGKVAEETQRQKAPADEAAKGKARKEDPEEGSKDLAEKAGAREDAEEKAAPRKDADEKAGARKEQGDKRADANKTLKWKEKPSQVQPKELIPAAASENATTGLKEEVTATEEDTRECLPDVTSSGAQVHAQAIESVGQLDRKAAEKAEDDQDAGHGPADTTKIDNTAALAKDKADDNQHQQAERENLEDGSVMPKETARGCMADTASLPNDKCLVDDHEADQHGRATKEAAGMDTVLSEIEENVPLETSESGDFPAQCKQFASAISANSAVSEDESTEAGTDGAMSDLALCGQADVVEGKNAVDSPTFKSADSPASEIPMQLGMEESVEAEAEPREVKVQDILGHIEVLKGTVKKLGGLPVRSASQQMAIRTAMQVLERHPDMEGCEDVWQEWKAQIQASKDPVAEARRIISMVEGLQRQGFLKSEMSGSQRRFRAQNSKVRTEDKMVLELATWSSLRQASSIKPGETGWVPTFRI